MELLARHMWVLVVLGLSCLIASCLYDPSAPCGDGQILDAKGLCRCGEGHFLGDDGCVACGPNEEVSANACVCVEGFQRTTMAEPCAPAPVGLGAECDVVSAPCDTLEAPHCHQAVGTAGYCTTVGCSSSSECAPNWSCAEHDERTYCQSPPTGLGMECSAPADCAGFEAEYCESLVLQQCLVRGCSVETNDCPGGWTCCDLGDLGFADTLCLPVESCDVIPR